MNKIFLLSASLIALSSSFAGAQDHSHHRHGHVEQTGFYGHAEINVYVTDIYNAEESDDEVTDIFSHSHVDMGYRFDRNWSVRSSLMLEGDPAGHSHGGGTTRTGNRFFDDHPLFIEELTVNYDSDHFGGYVGKFNPVLGLEAHDVPGWWGMLTFEEFEIRERLGGGAYVQTHLDGLGHQRFDLSTYFADTTFLGESLLYDRDTLDGTDGGPANTEDFASVSANLSGDLALNGLGYYIGYAHQGVDQADERDENRYTLGLNYRQKLTDQTGFLLFGDVTDISHLDGEADHDRRYATLGGSLTYNQWVLGGSYTEIHNDASDAEEGLDGYNAQISLGYNFGNGFGIDAGYQAQKEEGEAQDRIGTLLRYHADF